MPSARATAKEAHLVPPFHIQDPEDGGTPQIRRPKPRVLLRAIVQPEERPILRRAQSLATGRRPIETQAHSVMADTSVKPYPRGSSSRGGFRRGDPERIDITNAGPIQLTAQGDPPDGGPVPYP